MQKKTPVLILRLEGPLQSWGERSKWDTRDTAPFPTKSGIVGLIGCALGLERGDAKLTYLDKNIELAVREDYHGPVIEDYHTVQSDKILNAKGERRSGNTIVSKRYYIQDAGFTVALTSKDDKLLSLIAQALRKPRWPVYLGRKSCVPSRPVFDGFYDVFSDLEEALIHIPLLRDTGKREVPAEFEITEGGSMFFNRQDRLGTEPRVFQMRTVTRKILMVKEDCDVFDANKAE